MTFDEAKALLSKSHKCELNDHAFGDSEVTWLDDVPSNEKANEVATGYFGKSASVYITDTGAEFTGIEAKQLRECCVSVVRERNDETGPDTYQDGVTMPGLTLEGVRKELAYPLSSIFLDLDADEV